MGRDTLKSGCKIGAMLGTTALALTLLPAFKDSTLAVPSGATANVSVGVGLSTAGFGDVEPAADARRLLAWIEQTRDHGSQAFVVVDKRAAEVHVFNANARWVASSPVLLGVALGDDSVPGIGSRPMAMIEAHERTTPAGRFIGEQGRNTAGEDLVWVDYDAAVSMHRVRLTQRSERRTDRLSSPSAADNRISHGCINVPVAFHERHIQPWLPRERANVDRCATPRSFKEPSHPMENRMKTPMALITLCASVMFLGACDKTTPAPSEPIVNQPGPSEPGPTTGSVANPPVPSAESVFPPGKVVDPALGETDGTRKPKQESEVKLMPGQNNDHSAPLGPTN